MNLSHTAKILTTLVLIGVSTCISAFVVSLPTGSGTTTRTTNMIFGTRRTSIISTKTSLQMAVVELAPEPEGGEEVTPIDTMPNSRMKNMGPCSEVKTDDDGNDVYNFWLRAEADGALIKEIKKQILRDASKKANFPGFRKGQIPPYAMPQMTQFAIQEGIIKTCEAAVSAYGLKSLPGSDGEVNVNEEVPEMSKGYKDGTSLPFTATLRAALDPEKVRPSEEAESSTESEDEEVAATSE